MGSGSTAHTALLKSITAGFIRDDRADAGNQPYKDERPPVIVTRDPRPTFTSGEKPPNFNQT